MVCDDLEVSCVTTEVRLAVNEEAIRHQLAITAERPPPYCVYGTCPTCGSRDLALDSVIGWLTFVALRLHSVR